MKKSILNKSRWLFTIVLLLSLSIGNAWATDVSFAKSDFTKNNDGTVSASKSNVSISCVGNKPSSGTYVTFTEGNTLTISSTGGNITAIDFTCSDADYTGNLSDVSGISTTSWSISVNNPGNKTTVRVTGITVTISAASCSTDEVTMATASLKGSFS